MTVVYTGGTFDLFHAGHIDFLAACRLLSGPGGKVIAALNTDEFVARFKGRPPVNPLDERLQVLGACRYIDKVVVNEGGEDSRPTIEQAGSVGVIAVGSDWAGRDYYAQMGFDAEWLAERRILVAYLDTRHRGLSSSLIRSRLEGEL